MKPKFTKRPSEFCPPVFAKKAIPSNRGWVNPDGTLVVANSGLLDRMNEWEKKAKLELTKEIAPESCQQVETIAPVVENTFEVQAEEPKKKRGGGRKKKSETSE